MKNLSGTKFRQMLRAGDEIPTWYAESDATSEYLVYVYYFSCYFYVYVMLCYLMFTCLFLHVDIVATRFYSLLLFYDFYNNEIFDSSLRPLPFFLFLALIFLFLFRFAFESVVKVLREEAQAAPQ